MDNGKQDMTAEQKAILSEFHDSQWIATTYFDVDQAVIIDGMMAEGLIERVGADLCLTDSGKVAGDLGNDAVNTKQATVKDLKAAIEDLSDDMPVYVLKEVEGKWANATEFVRLDLSEHMDAGGDGLYLGEG